MKNKTLGIIIAIILLSIGVVAQIVISLDPSTKQAMEDKLKIFTKYTAVEVLTISNINNIPIWKTTKSGVIIDNTKSININGTDIKVESVAFKENSKDARSEINIIKRVSYG